MEILSKFINWTNLNSGFLGFLLFLFTLVIGWLSGAFKALRRKPKLKIEILKGPTFCASFDTGRINNSQKTHRTAIVLYLSITNTGSAPTDIGNIHLGYKSVSQINPFKWFWLTYLTVSKSDFVMALGEDVKVYPFLKQKNQLINNQTDTYLQEGKSCNGVVYFEQCESWGGYYPKTKNNEMVIKVKVFDAYGGKHYKKGIINKVTLEAAKEVCEKFGETIESLITNQEKP